MMNFMENHHLCAGVVPVAEAFNGANVRSDVYNLENWDEITFLIIRGAGAVGMLRSFGPGSCGHTHHICPAEHRG